ncbi:glycoside hydrolase family 43 protein [Marinimicrobium agarilyticum]|uniref:glycoside hydrolase family 43 protein n=1 Tax=Marinimicrobium agarilyticum TaxID=306546 RepID=UPI000484120D|nr:glycoside hydrolase family 43 protein [Marinimicrobium agarilyticum]
MSGWKALGLLWVLVLSAGCQAPPTQKADTVYLFSSFRGNGEGGLHLAYSRDGLTWTALRDDQSFLKPSLGGGLMRDPCIIQGPDGAFHMVWTTGWEDQGLGVAHSEDLVNWSEQQFVPVMAHEPEARNTWAPEIFWDEQNKQYVIYWATTIPERFPETASTGDDGLNHRIYYTTTRDFESYTDTKLFYEPGFNVIDSTIVRDGEGYVMILKDETRHPAEKNLRVARSDSLYGPWSTPSEPFTPDGVWVEGPTLLRTGEHFIVYYDEYIEHEYGAMRTRDFETWENISDRIDFPEGTRHGTVFTVPESVLEEIKRKVSEP